MLFGLVLARCVSTRPYHVATMAHQRSADKLTPEDEEVMGDSSYVYRVRDASTFSSQEPDEDVEGDSDSIPVFRRMTVQSSYQGEQPK